MITSTQSHPAPGKWPFPPTPRTAEYGLGDALRNKRFTGARMQTSGGDSASPFGSRHVLADVVLVVAWGAMIPGLLWLGYAAGF